MTVSKAEKTLTDKGFVVESKIETVASDTIKKNRIVKTDPEKGRVVKKGTKITLYKSTGVKTYKLLSYIEKNYKESVSELQEYGVIVDINKIDPDESTCKYIGKDVIVEQSLAEGSEIKSGDRITFKILNNVEFPDWLGQTADVVSEWCNKNCVTLTVTTQETADSSQIDKVISQTRPKGSTVKNNDEVTIVIGKKSSTVTEKKEDTTKPKEDDQKKDTETTDKTTPTPTE